ncbi:MAG: ABC transporter permease [Desulfurococcales archaeon]|nr:ABC transporter permease [Desulfurococcales archaeon]
MKQEIVKLALSNSKVKAGIAILAGILVLAALGPYTTGYGPLDYTGNIGGPPSREHPLGTNSFGYDVYAQIVYGLRGSLAIGLLGGIIATLIGISIGLASGYLGGLTDELLMMITNIFLVIPTLALLIIIAAYIEQRGIGVESLIIGFTAWPWTARAVRANTLSLRNREFVYVAKLSGLGGPRILVGEIMPNMLSYIIMVFILQFGGAILYAVGLDFLGLGPTDSISLGVILQQAVLWNAVQLGMWWWAIPPGLLIAVLLTSLYLINTGLDEVLNPRLRR